VIENLLYNLKNNER